jgi:HK97 family phage major capsid protein
MYTPNPRERDLLAERLPGIGMTTAEVGKYSLLRALSALASPERHQREGLEFEASRAAAQALGKDPDLVDPHSLFIPPEILTRGTVQRDLNVATPGEGGHLVETRNVSFIELLRNRSVVLRLGATRLPGLRGDAAIPKQVSEATAFWLQNETTEITESQLGLDQVPLSPKTAGAYTEISRKLTLQSTPAAEGLVMSDLASVVGLAVDAAAINGSGSLGQPLGLLGTTGVHTASGTSLGFASILETQSDTLGDNALINQAAVGYATTPAVAAMLMNRVKFTGTASPLWEGNMSDGQLVGYRAISSKQIPTATLIFGDWSQLALGEWGILEVAVNPFANFKAGIIGIRAMYSVDVGIRHAESFCKVETIT